MQPKKGKRDWKREKQAPRYLGEPKNKSPTEVTIERSDSDAYADNYYDDFAPISILHVGSHVIELTATSYEDCAIAWVNNTLHEQRHLLRRSGGPLVVSLCAFKGLPAMKKYWAKGPTAHPNHPSNPYGAISICLGGSHVLFYRHDNWYGSEFTIKPLKHLLEDKKVVVIGMGIKELAKKLLDQWGLRIARPVDLRKVVANAYGKNAVWWPSYKKEQVVMDCLGLEEMAELVLEGIRLEKKPPRVLEADWSDDHRNDIKEMELRKYAGRDAFLYYEIATNCIRKAGGLPSDA